MADNVEYTTTNAAGNSWVDSVPAAVSTGYQAQNTTIEAAYNGLDNSYVYYDSGTDEIVIPPSGPIDNNGVLVSVKTEIRLTVASAGDWYLRIIPGTTSTVFDIELTSSKGTWSAAKNALYDTSGYRVLNWKVVYNSTNQSVIRMYDNGFSGILQTSNGSHTDTNEIKFIPSDIIKESFSSPSTSPQGLAYDTSSGNLISCDNASNTIYVHSGVTSTILTSFSSPASDIIGIAYDRSTGNLISSDRITDTIYIHSGITSTILTSFSSPSTEPRGVMYDPSTGNLISCDDSTNTIYVHSGITSTILTSFLAPGVAPIGLAYEMSTGNLISSDTNDVKIYVHSGMTDFIITSFTSPSTAVRGITYDSSDGNLISCDSNSDTIYTHASLVYK